MDIRLFQEQNGLRSNDVVAAMRTGYPKYDKHIHSRVMHPETYGVKLVREAEQLIEGIFSLTPQKPRRAENRRNPYRLSFRINKTILDQLQLAQKRCGMETMQDFLTHIVLTWLEGENESST